MLNKIAKALRTKNKLSKIIFGSDAYSLKASAFKHKIYGPKRKTGKLLCKVFGLKQCKKKFNNENNLFNHNIKDY